MIGQFVSVDAKGKFSGGSFITYGTGKGIDVSAGLNLGSTATDKDGFAGPYNNINQDFVIASASAHLDATTGQLLGQSYTVGPAITTFGSSTTNTNTVLFGGGPLGQ